MKVKKLEELLLSLQDKEAEIVLDKKCYEELKYNSIYDLTILSIENKNEKTVIKLSFDEREDNTKKCTFPSRMKSMNIDLDKIQQNTNVNVSTEM